MPEHRRQTLLSLADDRQQWANDHSRWAFSSGSFAIGSGFLGLLHGRLWFLGLVFVPIALWHLHMVCLHRRAAGDLRQRAEGQRKHHAPGT